VAATLTDSGQLTYVSFGIEKVESTPDGDLMVYGRASDGSVDHDQQIVHPDFSSKAIAEWLSTGGNVRVQHNAQRDPAGIGVEAHTDADGATWVKALIVEPIAKTLVSKGALRAYSVGIANPSIERDVTGKARGGIIKAGKIVEISLVDRPANSQCGFQLVKSIDGHAEYVGKMVGDENAITKALNSTMTEKPAVSTDIDGFEVPKSFSIDFTPNDLAKLVMDKMKKKVIDDHYAGLAKDAAYDPFRYSTAEKRDFDPGVGGGVDRDKLGESDFAGPHRSFPVVNQSDVSDALHLVGHADDPAAVRARIHDIARRKGFSVPDGDNSKTVTEPEVTTAETAEEVKTDTPDIVKDPETVTGSDGAGPNPATPGKNVPPKPSNDDDDDDVEDKATGKAAMPPKKGGKKGKKLPPWLNKPGADADDSASKAAGCTEDHEHTDKCGPLPAPKETQQPETAPLPELKESPAKPHMKGAQDVLMRYKTIGMDTDLGMLHDFTCPAYDPNEIAQLFPLAGVDTLIDVDLWQRKALNAATGKSLTEALEAQNAWQAASLLKTTDPAEVNQYRYEAHKAFRDANPGPTSAPTPCEMGPGKFHRPYITDGHADLSSGYGSPNSSAKVPDTSPNAHSFGRPPLGSGHQSPSPSHMKADMEYPTANGVPTQIRYAEVEKEKARRALSMLHDHLNHMFPSSCPMLDHDAYAGESVPTHPIAAAGHSKEVRVTETSEVLADVYKDIRKLEARVLLGEITEEQARAKLSRKAAKRYAASLHKQVQSGITSIDEVRKALGIEPPAAPREVEVAAPPVAPDMTLKAAGANALTPDIMKTMMSEILEPLTAKITALEERNASYEEKIEAQNSEIDTYRQRLTVNDQRWDALANQPDPSTAAFAGLALNNPAQKNAPAGIVKQAEHHERIQGMMMRQLERTWRTSENPAEREAAYNALLRHKGDISE
jgi:hypothetical protein